MVSRQIGEPPDSYIQQVLQSLPPGTTIQDPAVFHDFVEQERRKYLAQTAGFDALSPDDQEIYILEQSIRNLGGTVKSVAVLPGDLQGYKQGLSEQLQSLLRTNSQGQTLIEHQQAAQARLPIYNGIPEDELQRRLMSGRLITTPVLNLPQQTAQRWVPGDNPASRLAENILVQAAAQTSPAGIATAIGTAGLGPAAQGAARGVPLIGRPLAGLVGPAVEGPFAKRALAELALNIGSGAGSQTAAQYGAPVPLQIAAGFAGGAGALAAPKLTTTTLRAGQRAATGAAESVAERGVGGALRNAADRVSPVGLARAAGPEDVRPSFRLGPEEPIDNPAFRPTPGLPRREGAFQPREFFQNVLDESGQNVARVKVTLMEDLVNPGVTAHIAIAGDGPNRLGPAVVRNIAQQLLDAHPEIARFRGLRETGARGARATTINQGLQDIPASSFRRAVPPVGPEDVTPRLPQDPQAEDLGILRGLIDEDAAREFPVVRQAAEQAVAPAKARGAVLSLPETADEIAQQAAATNGVVEKLTTLVRGFRRISPELRAQLEAARSGERKQIAARQFSRLKNLDPGDPRRLAAIRAAQKGQLAQFGNFESIKSAFSEDEIRLLNSQIGQKFTVQLGQPANEANALEALNKLLSGQVPTEGEMKLLEIAFGPEIRRAVDQVTKSGGRKAWELFMDAMGLPRGLLSSFDISAVMRQGGVLTVAHPRKALWGRESAFVRMVKALASEDAAKRSIDSIRADRDYELLAGPNSRVPIFLHDVFETNLSRREELFASRWLKRIPGVRASERAFATYLNEIRYKSAKDYVSKLRAQGLNDAQIQPGLERMARFLNVATGRGTLGVAEKSRLIREMATVTFWSPRLVASRIQTPIEGLRALKNINAEDPAVRAASRQIARDLATYTGGMISFLTLLDLSGLADVEADPRSSDFGKIRVGNTRLDTWGGFQQPARYVAQFIMGQRKSATSGEVYGVPRDEVLGRFIRSKLAPGGPSLAASALPEDTVISGLTGGGEDFIGQPLWPDSVVQQFIPLIAQDIQDAVSAQGLNGALLSIPDVVGIGTQTFDTPSQNGGNLSPTARALFPDIARQRSQSSEVAARERP